jgi:hypothetical protein
VLLKIKEYKPDSLIFQPFLGRDPAAWDSEDRPVSHQGRDPAARDPEDQPVSHQGRDPVAQDPDDQLISYQGRDSYYSEIF